MLATLWTLTLTAVLGQAAPPETALLKAAPTDADVVIRVRGIESTRNDLNAMLKAMSPTLAGPAAASFEKGVGQLTQQFGEEAARSPFLILIRAVVPEDGNPPPFAVLVQGVDYQKMLKSVAGGPDVAPKEQPGGFDAFDGPQDTTWYAVKGGGFVAFGPDKTLIAGIAKPGDQALDAQLSDDLRQRLFRGELGLYANVATLRSRYGEQIEQAKQKMFAAFDQAGPRMGNAGTIEQLRTIYGGLFDAVKVVDGLALSYDFAAEGLDVAGAATIKPDTDAAKALAEARAVTTEELAGMPADATYFTTMSVDPKSFSRLQALGMSAVFGGAAPPQVEQAVKLQNEMGPMTVAGAARIAEGGMQGLNVIHVADPQKYIDANVAVMEAMAKPPGEDSPLSIVKDMKVTPNAETYKSYTFTRAEMTFDLEKMAEMQPNNPGGAAGMTAMLGGKGLTTWCGTDGQQVLSVVAHSWDQAKAWIDAYLAREQTIGATAGFKAVCAKLPESTSVLMLISAQGLVEQLALQFAATFNNPDLKPPADLPQEPALMGAAVVGKPEVVQFQLVVPSAVGPVIEKGLIPLFSGLQGKVNQ